MVNRLRSLPVWAKGLIKATLLSISLGCIFLSYLYFVGMPKTAARNLFNRAEMALALGNTEKGYLLLRQALASYPEEYILERIRDIEE